MMPRLHGRCTPFHLKYRTLHALLAQTWCLSPGAAALRPLQNAHRLPGGRRTSPELCSQVRGQRTRQPFRSCSPLVPNHLTRRMRSSTPSRRLTPHRVSLTPDVPTRAAPGGCRSVRTLSFRKRKRTS
eukprot:6480554-Prymnesium_polylepis.1